GVAVLVTEGSSTERGRRKLAGGVWQTAPQHSQLCRWGLQSLLPKAVATASAAVGAAAGKAADTAALLKAQLERGLRQLGLDQVLPAAVLPVPATARRAARRVGGELGL